LTTYIAWDGNDYPNPPPADWYLASDSRWWPTGYGPGPAVGPPPAAPPVGPEAVAPPIVAPPSVAPPTAAPGTTAPPTVAPPQTAPPQTDKPYRSGGGGKALLIVLVTVAALGGAAFYLLGLSSEDDSTAAVPATSVPRTETTEDPGPTSSAPEDNTAPDTAVAAPSKGSVDDPYDVGDEITISYALFDEAQRAWVFEVLGPASDRTQAVLDENQFNTPPPGDTRFVVTEIRVSYVSGPDDGSLFDFNFTASGPSGDRMTTFDPSCGVVPDSFDSLLELNPGETVTGNICWVVAPPDIEELTMGIEVFFVDGSTYVRLN